MGFVVPRCPGLDDRTERQVGRPNLTAFTLTISVKRRSELTNGSLSDPQVFFTLCVGVAR